MPLHTFSFNDNNNNLLFKYYIPNLFFEYSLTPLLIKTNIFLDLFPVPLGGAGEVDFFFKHVFRMHAFWKDLFLQYLQLKQSLARHPVQSPHLPLFLGWVAGRMGLAAGMMGRAAGGMGSAAWRLGWAAGSMGCTTGRMGWAAGRTAGAN